MTAAAPCVGCEVAQANQGLAFYQVAASVFVVLLLTGVAGEIRDLRGERTEGKPRVLSRRYTAAVGLVFAALVAGELLALSVLLEPPAHAWQQWSVALCLLASVLGVPTLIVQSLWEERFREFRRRLSLVFGAIVIALVGIAGYLAFVAITHSPANHTYHVYGTCASTKPGGMPECGLNERSLPTSHSKRLRELHDGEKVSIACQTTGGEVRDPSGGSSIVWDRLDSGGYITDLYVDTPPLSSGIQLCSSQVEAGSPHG